MDMDSPDVRKLHSEFLDLSPTEFERIVAKIWENKGWETQVTSGTNDTGVDIVATNSAIYDTKAAIQVKRYDPSNKIGRPDVQQYDTLRRQDTSVDLVILVTTSGFSKQATDLAKQLNVKLIGGEQIAEVALENLSEETLSQYIAEPSKPVESETTGDSQDENANTSEYDLSHVLSSILGRQKLIPAEKELIVMYENHHDKGPSSYGDHPGSSLIFEFDSPQEYLEIYQVLVGIHSIEFDDRKRWLEVAKTAKKYSWKIDNKSKYLKDKAKGTNGAWNPDHVLNLEPNGERTGFDPVFEVQFTTVVLEEFLDTSYNELSAISETDFDTGNKTQIADFSEY
jgi:hypothetical protein